MAGTVRVQNMRVMMNHHATWLDRGKMPMWSALDIMGFLILGVALAAPLGYALATLRGMRSKTVYPLFRLRGEDGHTVPLVVEQTCGQDTGRLDDARRRCIRLPA